MGVAIFTRAKAGQTPSKAALGARGAPWLALVLCLGLWGCNPSGTDQKPPEPGDVVVARIDKDVVWKSDVHREAVAQGLIGEGEPLDAGSSLFGRVLEEVIDQKLLASEAVNRNLDKTPLAQRRLDAAKERILGDMLVENTVDSAIDDKAVEALYQEQLKLAKKADEIRARQILVKTEADAASVAKLIATGASFEALAMERSIDQATRFNGGDLGYFTTDIMPDAYAKALKDAQKGQVIGPFAVSGGYALVKIEDRRQEAPLSLEEARPQIVRFLTYDQVKQLLTKLRGKAKVEMLVKSDPLSNDPSSHEPAHAPKPAAVPRVVDATAAPSAPLTASQAPKAKVAPKSSDTTVTKKAH